MILSNSTKNKGSTGSQVKQGTDRRSWNGNWAPGGSDGYKFACDARDPSLIPGSGRLPGEGNGKTLLHSFLEDPIVGGAWWATVHGVTKSQTWLSDFHSQTWEGLNRYIFWESLISEVFFWIKMLIWKG